MDEGHQPVLAGRPGAPHRASREARLGRLLLSLTLLLPSLALRAESLGAAASRGQAIYTTGEPAGGPRVSARILGDVEVPATQHPCMQCHGADGRGGRDGGIETPGIRWSRLAAPHGALRGGRDWRPPYTVASFARAVREGLDSRGEPLDPMMPRYALPDDAVEDLAAYLRALAQLQAPGVGADRIRVGALLPLRGPLAARGQAIEALLRGAFVRLNGRGGIHGRALELVTADVAEAEAVDAARSLVEGPDPVFCMVANAGAGAAPEVETWLAERGVPVIGPLSFPATASSVGSTFYLLAPLGDQARAAARFLARSTRGPVALAAASSEAGRVMAEAFASEAAARDLAVLGPAWLGDPHPAVPVGSWQSAGSQHLVVFAGPQTAAGLLAELRGSPWRPTVVAPRVLLGVAAAALGPETVWIQPAVGPGGASALLADFEELAAGSGASEQPRANRALEMTAYAAARVLAETLMRVGREVDRERVVATLEGLRDFESGVMPPIRFGPNRRVAVRGALLVRGAADGPPRVEWVDLDAP